MKGSHRLSVNMGFRAVMCIGLPETRQVSC